MRVDLESIMGKYNNCYISYSTEQKIRANGSSGGVVTSLLIFALKKGIINGALTVRMNPQKPLEPEVFIARNEQEICSAQGSKYIQIPFDEIIKAIEKENGRFAVVGLPCHIKILRAIMNKREDINKKIVFTIGLFCGRTVSPEGTSQLVKRLGVDEDKIKEIQYRKGEWPGAFQITQIDNKKISIPYQAYWPGFYNYYAFTPESCLYCLDVLNESADISCGDAWLPEVKKNDKLGTSMIIARTLIGEKIIFETKNEGLITLQTVKPEEIIRAQWTSLYFKKLGGYNRILIKQSKWNKAVFSILRKEGVYGLNAALFPILCKKINSCKYLKNINIKKPSAVLNIIAILSNLIGYMWYKKLK